MKFFREGHLFVPREEIAKGRSMVGYSRRGFLDFLGLGVTALALPLPLLPDVKYQTLASLFDDLSEAAGFDWSFRPDWTDIKFGSENHDAFRLGHVINIEINDVRENFIITALNFEQPLNKEFQVSVEAQRLPDFTKYGRNNHLLPKV